MKAKIRDEIRSLFSTKEQLQNEEYEIYLDMVKGIAIFLVVLGHSGTISISINKWLSTFHLPAFFIISGILMNLTQKAEIPFSIFLKNKIKQILVPYLCFSFVTIFFLLINIFANVLEWKDLTQLICQTLSLQGYSAMWFLTTLFFAEIYVIILLKGLKRIFNKNINTSIILCIITTVFAIIIYNFYHNYIFKVVPVIITNEIRIFVKAFVGSAFISYGYLIWNILSYIDNVKSTGSKKNIRRVIEVLIGTVLFSVNIIILPYIQLMDLNNLNVGELYQYLLLGVGGCFSLLLICRNTPNIPIMSYCGQNSLIIMCTHLNFYVLFIALFICQFVAAHLPGNYDILWCLSSMICVICLEIVLIIMIKIYFPFMLGKCKKRSN